MSLKIIFLVLLLCNEEVIQSVDVSNTEANEITSFAKKKDYSEIQRKELPKSSQKKRKNAGATPLVRESGVYCEPEHITVKLKISEEKELEEGYMYFPTHVKLWHCGGCCRDNYRSCQPTETQTITFKVRIVHEAKDKRKKTGLRRDWVNGTAEQHDSCACVCHKSVENYDSDNHIWKNKTCSYKCNDSFSVQEWNCKNWTSDNLVHRWDIDSCQCQSTCREEKKCSSGRAFDPNTCKCEYLNNEAW